MLRVYRYRPSYKKEINPQSTDFTGFLQNRGIQLEPNVNIKRMIIVNESGMYSAIFNSELKTAKKFNTWIKERINKYKFLENVDFTIVDSFHQNGGKSYSKKR